MNRLTERDEYGNADIIGVDSEDLQLNLDFEGFNRVTEALNRLAAYEDTGLEPEQCAKYAQAEKEGRYIVLKEPRSAGVHMIEEIARADIEGRLVMLPCKVGDTIYEIDLPEYGVIVCKVIWIDYYIGPAAHIQGNEMVAAVSVSVEVIDGHGKGSCYAFEQSDFGKTVFLTRGDAEKALEEMKK